jgi:hypothetical protein
MSEVELHLVETTCLECGARCKGVDVDPEKARNKSEKYMDAHIQIKHSTDDGYAEVPYLERVVKPLKQIKINLN